MYKVFVFDKPGSFEKIEFHYESIHSLMHLIDECIKNDHAVQIQKG